MELEFRVWDSNYKEFRYWGFLKDGIFTSLPTNNLLTLDYCKEKTEQYSNKKDIEGKKLFAGDIVRNEFDEIFVIEFRYFDFEVGCYCGACGTVGFALTPREFYGLNGLNDCSFGMQEHQELKKIGTIHENPDLLEASQ
jgi:hypothetical protein